MKEMQGTVKLVSLFTYMMIKHKQLKYKEW